MSDRLPSFLLRHAGCQPVASPSGLSVTSSSASTASTIEGWENAVDLSRAKHNQIFRKSDQTWSDRIDLDGLGRFLRAEHPDKTAEHVAGQTGLPPDTVRKWLLGVARPNLRAGLGLVFVYGPELLAALFRDPPDWIDDKARAAEQARLEGELALLRARARGAA